jgi:hypothetical protein
MEWPTDEPRESTPWTRSDLILGGLVLLMVVGLPLITLLGRS